jgi:hypothetical protein
MFTFLVASNYLWRGPRRDNVSRGHWSVQESIPKLSVGTMDIDSDLIAIQRSIGPQRRRPQIILIDLHRHWPPTEELELLGLLLSIELGTIRFCIFSSTFSQRCFQAILWQTKAAQ